MRRAGKRSAGLGILFLMVFMVSMVCGRVMPAANAEGMGAGILLAGLFGSDSKVPAPDFDLQDLKGSNVKLSQFRGDRPVMLYFWATWCPSCVSIKPHIAKVREKVGEKEMEILGINVGEGDSLEKVKRYQEGHPVTWPVLYDVGSKVARTYKVQGIPMFVLINKEGMIVYQGNDMPQDPLKLLK
jgi:thiol-disulfide isomerase/thioredoxin